MIHACDGFSPVRTAGSLERPNRYDENRETYDGPLSMATDMMVWNITSDGITERMDVTDANQQWLDAFKKEHDLSD